MENNIIIAEGDQVNRQDIIVVSPADMTKEEKRQQIKKLETALLYLDEAKGRYKKAIEDILNPSNKLRMIVYVAADESRNQQYLLDTPLLALTRQDLATAYEKWISDEEESITNEINPLIA